MTSRLESAARHAETAGMCLASPGAPVSLCAMILAPALGTEDLTAAVAHARAFTDAVVTSGNPAIRNFSEARNGLLATAAAGGFDWGVVLDLDERIQVADPPALRRHLADCRAAVILAPDQERGYLKHRFFRLPARGRFIGLVHEHFVEDAGAARERLSTLSFFERPKTHAQERLKAERDRELLEIDAAEDPENPRWWHYLGRTHVTLGRSEDAAAAFERCYRLDGPDKEEAAWSCYQLAALWLDEDPDAALSWCLLGMQRHPGMAELPCLAGWCCFWLGRYQHAIRWAEMAVALNVAGADRERISSRHPAALHEAPFDLMRRAARVLGDGDRERYAERRFAEMFLAREGWSSRSVLRREDARNREGD